MCGIAGFGGKGPLFQNDPKAVLKSMTDQIAVRGPDGEGQWVSERDDAALGHRRLSIVDLSDAGAQPMVSHSGRYVISYNGEIYNSPQLRKTLSNVAWRGGSDTEVLLALIECHGVEKTLGMLDGMFALAIYDLKDKRLILARDRFGEKPLYWGMHKGHVIFASQLHAFAQLPGFHPDLDQQALADYFKYSYVPAPRSVFKGIQKLLPGHFLEFDLTQALSAPQPQCFWDLVAVAHTARADGFKGSFEDAKARARELMSASVQRRLMSDVPLGALLSGGIDSTLTTAMMQQVSNAPVRTFTIGMPVSGFNEADHARDVATQLGTDHTELMLTNRDIENSIQKMGAIYDEPFSDSSQVPTFLVSEMAKRDVTVALTGDGADELFGGYNRYISAPNLWRKARAIPAPLRKLGGRMMGALPVSLISKLAAAAGSKELASGRAFEKIEKLRRVMSAGSSTEFHDALLTTGWQTSGAIGLAGQNLAYQELDRDFVSNLMLNDSLNYLSGDILVKTDRAAMAVGLELRTPYLERDLFEFAWSLPAEMKIQNGQGKRILRSLLYDLVPQEMVDRPKAGFAIPLGHWLRNDLKVWAGDLLSPDRLKCAEIYDTGEVVKIWNEHLAGKENHENFLWSVLMFESWKESSLTHGFGR